MVDITSSKGRWLSRTDLFTRVLLAVAFAYAGLAKLAGGTMMVEVFDDIGVGQWFRLTTGAVEAIAAALILVPSLAWIGASLLVGTMAGAVLIHLFVIGGSPLPAIVLLTLSLYAVWTRRRDLPFGVGSSSS